MSDSADRRAEAQQLDAEAEIPFYNARAWMHARQGPPGDPPELVCADCGAFENICRCTAGDA